MRNKRTRIVCEVVTVSYTRPNGDIMPRDVWQEVYTSPYKVDCVNWVARQQELDRKNGVNKVYHIFVSEQ